MAAREKPLCFVIMPFESAKSLNGNYDNLTKDNLDTIYDLLEGILTRTGYKVRRSSSKGDILSSIIFDLDRADLVVADLTGLNPNVMYELGIRHGFTKKTMLLSQDVSELPFDLKNYHCIKYGWKNKKEKDKLSADIRETLKEINSDPNVKFGPVHSHLGSKRLALREEELRKTTKRLGALEAELHLIFEPVKNAFEQTRQLHADMFEETDTGYRLTGKLDMSKSNPFFQAVVGDIPSSFPATDFLLTSRYLPDELDFNGQISTYYQYLGGLRFHYLRVTDYTFQSHLSLLMRAHMVLSDTVAIHKAITAGDLSSDLQLLCKKENIEQVNQPDGE